MKLFSTAVVAIVLLLAMRPACASVVLYTDDYPRATAGERIAAALAAIPAQGGVVDARKMSVINWIVTPLNVGSGGRPTTLLLGPGWHVTTAMITVYEHSSILGVPQGSSSGFPPDGPA